MSISDLFLDSIGLDIGTYIYVYFYIEYIYIIYIGAQLYYKIILVKIDTLKI